jgi:thiol-disulfide isomerase/thioredoxin
MIFYNRRRSTVRASLKSFWLPAFVLVGVLIFEADVRTPAQADEKSTSQPAQNGAADSLVPVDLREPAPVLSVTDIDGKKVRLSQYRGKVILLDFWAVDCGGCVIEIPWYVEFDKKYHDKGLRLVGIDMYGESPAYIRPYMEKSHMQYPVAVGDDDIRKRFQAGELPKTMLIDREGRVAVSHIGIVDKTMFEHDIQELLK